jgi:hypothetical protein
LEWVRPEPDPSPEGSLFLSRSFNLQIPALFLTALPERLPTAIRSQAHGFLLTSCTVQELEAAIHWILANYDKERADQDKLEKERALPGA